MTTQTLLISELAARLSVVNSEDQFLHRYIVDEAARLSVGTSDQKKLLISSGIQPLEFGKEAQRARYVSTSRSGLDYMDRFQNVFGKRKSAKFAQDIRDQVFLFSLQRDQEVSRLVRLKWAVYYRNLSRVASRYGNVGAWNDVIDKIDPGFREAPIAYGISDFNLS